MKNVDRTLSDWNIKLGKRAVIWRNWVQSLLEPFFFFGDLQWQLGQKDDYHTNVSLKSLCDRNVIQRCEHTQEEAVGKSVMICWPPWRIEFPATANCNPTVRIYLHWIAKVYLLWFLLFFKSHQFHRSAHPVGSCDWSQSTAKKSPSLQNCSHF